MPISVKAALRRDGGKADPVFVSIAEIAKQEKVTPKTVYVWIIRGKLKDSAKKDADGIWRINKKKFKRPLGMIEQIKANAAARRKEKAAAEKSPKAPSKPAPSSAKSSPRKRPKAKPAKASSKASLKK